MAEVKKASRGHQEIEGGIELLANRRTQRTRLRPVMQLVHGGNQCKPVGDVAVAQPTRSLFQIRLKVVNSHPVLAVALAGDLGQALQQSLGFLHDQLGNHFVVEFAEQVAVSRQVAAIEQGDGEFMLLGS